MARYLFFRLLHMIPLLIGISFIAFAVLQLAPGDFFSQFNENPSISQETLNRMREEFGFNRPWYVQYLLWLSNAVRLNFGYSLENHVPVTQLLWERMGNTLLLSLCSLVLSWSIAIPLGILAGVRRNTLLDRAISLGAFAGVSIPGFFLALLLLLMAQRTGWFPIGGMHSVNADYMTRWGRFVDLLHHLALPVVVVTVSGFAGILRQMRGSLLDVLRENYVLAARARGLPERKVIFKHAARNAINPLVTVFGFSLASLLSGSALVERVMQWPGLGQLILSAVISKDLYLVMGSFVMAAILLLLGNLVGDLLLYAIDPRIKVESA
jgi:peptide/nickel transport system permease protein